MTNPKAFKVVSPGRYLGLLGGGQLGRMFCMAAQSLGFKVLVLDPDSDGPAATVADAQIQADYHDENALQQLAQRCDAVTTEFENVPAQALEILAKTITVSPSAAAVQIAQNRLLEKKFIASQQVPVAPYVELIPQQTRVDQNISPYLPGILKTARFGYDGKGQVRVATSEQLIHALNELGMVPCVLEKQLNLKLEVSVIVCRDSSGNTITYPVSENQHHQGILQTCIVPANIKPELADQARHDATTIAIALEYVGVLCVEFFILQDSTLVVNEIAPRPHNSGHYSINACITSQFEQQARILAGLPLGDPSLLAQAVMINLLGDLWFDDQGQQREPNWFKILTFPEVKLHLYGKAEPRPGRKMGHVTVVAASIEHALVIAEKVKASLGIQVQCG